MGGRWETLERSRRDEDPRLGAGAFVRPTPSGRQGHFRRVAPTDGRGQGGHSFCRRPHPSRAGNGLRGMRRPPSAVQQHHPTRHHTAWQKQVCRVPDKPLPGGVLRRGWSSKRGSAWPTQGAGETWTFVPTLACPPGRCSTRAVGSGGTGSALVVRVARPARAQACGRGVCVGWGGGGEGGARPSCPGGLVLNGSIPVRQRRPAPVVLRECDDREGERRAPTQTALCRVCSTADWSADGGKWRPVTPPPRQRLRSWPWGRPAGEAAGGKGGGW